MSDTAGTASHGGKRMGRPPKLDREMIARAAGELGLAGVTMRSVAERLGVSIPGLYHYVNGRDDLLRLAAQQLAARIALPEDFGQHWAGWLYQWADYVRTAFAAEPDVLEQYMHGVLGLDLMVDHLEIVVGFLVGRGFAPRAAYDAYQQLIAGAIGAAVGEIRNRDVGAAGHPVDEDYHRLVAARGPEGLPNLAQIVSDGASMRPAFTAQAATLLAGIAVRRGEDWQQVVDVVAAYDRPADPADRQPSGR